MIDLLVKTIKKEVVKCQGCKEEFDVDSEDFFTVYGNITKGLSGGLVGNNICDADNTISASIYCYECFKEIINR